MKKKADLTFENEFSHLELEEKLDTVSDFRKKYKLDFIRYENCPFLEICSSQGMYLCKLELKKTEADKNCVLSSVNTDSKELYKSKCGILLKFDQAKKGYALYEKNKN
jgi:hypothetical protein